MGKRKGKCVRKNPVNKETLEPENLVKAPHSFVIHRGQCSKNLIDLTKDFRKIMEPFTAAQLKERKKNTIKDFVSVSGYLHVSHMMIFSETELGTYLRLARLPRGPTLTFRVHNFSLARDVISSLRKQYVMVKAFQSAPLIVLNSFSGEGMHMKLMATMFQNMFPTINITTVKLKHIRRCVLLNYNPSSKLVELRHYAIRAAPVGLNRGTKKVVQGKIPNLNRCKDMSEFFDKAGLASESEGEEEAGAHVVLPQALASRAAAAESRSAIRLYELGPRIAMQLIKVEDGLLDGEVLFHELLEKTDEEKAAIKKRREEKKRMKERRKAQQEDNVRRKQREKDALDQRALAGMQRKKELTETQRLMELAAAEGAGGAGAAGESEEEDDATYYRQEVGEEPERDLFTKNLNRKRKSDDQEPRGFKKMRLDNKIKKKFHKSQDTSGQGQRAGNRVHHDKGGNKFQGKDGGGNFNNREAGKKFQNKNGGGRFKGRQGGGKFHNKDGGGRFKGRDGGGNFQNKDGGGRFKGREGGRKFQNKDGGGKYQNKDGGRGKFNRNSDQDKGFKKGKKVIGGKINKSGKGGRNKGKGRK